MGSSEESRFHSTFEETYVEKLGGKDQLAVG
jgi:hypothetical protein